jgi:hypothetical protein
MQLFAQCQKMANKHFCHFEEAKYKLVEKKTITAKKHNDRNAA